MAQELSPFAKIRRTTPAGNEFWSSRDFARILSYTDYRNFEAVIEKARTACFNSGQRVEDHFVEITEMVEIGKGGQRPVKAVMMSRYAPASRRPMLHWLSVGGQSTIYLFCQKEEIIDSASWNGSSGAPPRLFAA